MKKFFLKPYRWGVVFSLLLVGAFSFVLLDTFVIPKSLAVVPTEFETESLVETQPISQAKSEATVSETSYEDENMKISIETVQKYDSTLYVADIQLTDASYLKTALASNTFGRNIKETTSKIAEDHDAIFAVNGDYYGFKNAGYVLRNGTIYRDTVRNDSEDEDLVIDKDGNFSIISESQVSMKSLNTADINQIMAFGPALVEDGQITVDSTSEVSRAKSTNPRTAIGQISMLHYVVIVSDGRTSESEGISLLDLAQELKERGCTTAYNLDGGGSSTMYFNGKVINNPTDGRNAGEREVSDIVYIGY
ncbi:MAG: phosphodiester glycosidase family protein [Eubacteriales bacterium]